MFKLKIYIFVALLRIIPRQNIASLIVSIWQKTDLYLHYRIEDPISPHECSCSVIIILNNQIVTFMRLKVFWNLWPFDLLISVDYMPEVTWKRNNKTIFIIFKNTSLRLKCAIFLVEIMTQYANYKVHTTFT